MDKCPSCKTTPVVAHCPSPSCTWKRCPICRSFGTMTQMYPYVIPVSVEVLYNAPSIADADRNPPRPVFGG